MVDLYFGGFFLGLESFLDRFSELEPWYSIFKYYPEIFLNSHHVIWNPSVEFLLTYFLVCNFTFFIFVLTNFDRGFA